MTIVERVVVAGAGFAGINTALILARDDRYEVVLVDQRTEHVYTPGIIDLVRDRRSEETQKLSIEKLVEKTGIKFRNEEVTRFVPKDKVVETDKGRIDYDKLVLGMGGSKVEPIDTKGAYSFYTLRDAKELASKVKEDDRAIIIGSGYVGVELAGELSEFGCDVQIYEMESRPLPSLPEEVSVKTIDYFNEQGINFTGSKEAVSVDSETVEFADGTHDLGDFVVWNGGIQANEIVQRDFDCGRQGLTVSDSLKSINHKDVFAVGDNAKTEAEKTAHNAMEQAKTVAKAVKGQKPSYSPGRRVLASSLGHTGILILGSLSFKSRGVRYLKDFIRLYYKTVVKTRSYLAKIF